MHILLVAATTFEIQPTITFLGKAAPGRDLPAGNPLTTGYHITGIGSLLTTHSLMRSIAGRKPDLIIQAGIAGCFTGHEPGEVLVVKEEILGDLGVWESGQFKTIFDLNLVDKNAFPFTDGSLSNPYPELLTLTGLEQVKALTVNEITTDREHISWYQQYPAPVVESMEGGALHYVCLQEQIPFLQLRAVSNAIGIRDKTKWNIPLAIERLNKALIALIERLQTHGASQSIMAKK